MKKYLLIVIALFFLFSSVDSKAQSLELIDYDEQVTFSPDDFEGKNYAVVKNTTLGTINIKVKIDVVSLSQGHLFAVCMGGEFGTCYPPTNKSWDCPLGYPLGAGEDTGDSYFVGYVYPSGNAGVTILKFTFYVDGNPSDNVSFTTTFNVGTDVKDELLSDIKISPNPASDYLNIYFGNDFDTDYSVDIIDITGKSVRNMQMNTVTNGQIDISGLNNGTYMCRISDGVKFISQKLFIVSH